MRRSIALFVMFALVCSFAAAAQGAQSGIHEPGTGIDDPEIKEAGQGTGQGLEQDTGDGQNEMAQTAAQAGEIVRVRVKAQNSAELQQMFQQRKQEMEQEAEAMEDEGKKNAYTNQNQVRLAVHSLLAMEDLVVGIGPQVREVAMNFENSVEKTLQAEERVEKRSGFARFFAGGDAESAEEIEQEVEQNRERIQELKQLKEQCQCEEPVMAMLEAQIQSMEQEQTRLNALAQKEKASKGLLGWIWK